jgi:hypothetical protein
VFALTDSTANPGFKVTQFGLNNLWHWYSAEEPSYYDECAALYYRYRVVSCALTVEASTLGDTHDIAVMPVSATGDQPTTILGALEHRLSKTAVVKAGGNRDVTTVSNYVTVQDLAGDRWRDADLSSATGTSPATLLYWNIVTAPRVAAAANITMLGKTVFEAIWSDPRPSTSSA